MVIKYFCFSEEYEDIIIAGIYEFNELKFGFQKFLSDKGLELGYFKNDIHMVTLASI